MPTNGLEHVVFKIFSERSKFDYVDYESMRMDNLVAERLSSSSLIVDIYGSCGLAHLGESMPNGILDFVAVPVGYRDVQRELNITIPNKLQPATNQPLLPMNALKPSEKLRYSLEMARAIAELHGFVGGVIVHDDIQLSQFLFTQDMHLKLNDFNRAEIMLWDEMNQEYCKYRNHVGMGEVSGTSVVGQREVEPIVRRKTQIVCLSLKLFEICCSAVALTRRIF